MVKHSKKKNTFTSEEKATITIDLSSTYHCPFQHKQLI